MVQLEESKTKLQQDVEQAVSLKQLVMDDLIAHEAREGTIETPVQPAQPDQAQPSSPAAGPVVAAASILPLLEQLRSALDASSAPPAAAADGAPGQPQQPSQSDVMKQAVEGLYHLLQGPAVQTAGYGPMGAAGSGQQRAAPYAAGVGAY